MSNWRFAGVICVLGLALVLGRTARGESLPNFVFVIADDMTFREIGCYGGQAHTPHIDRLATEGMQFTRCFQAAPMCSPTRHNIYTGLYPVRSGAYPNHTFAKPGTKSIVHYLKPLGYRVALSGKTHIGPRSVFPFEYSGKKNPDMQVIDQLMKESKEAGTPFCLFACSNEPHSPWDKGDASKYPADKIELPPYVVDTPVVREAFRRYLAEVSYFDSQVGEILELLRRHDLHENTMVVVVSEQGNSFPFAKWTCYGNGLQSAMVVRWPGQVEPGSTCEALVEYTDIVPTFVEAAGGTPASQLEGASLISLLKGEKQQHKKYVYGLMTTRGIINGSDSYPIRTVRDERYRLIWNLNHEARFTNACTQADYFQSMKLAADNGQAGARELVRNYYFRPEYELFDCEMDPLEMTNLADQPEHRETLARLRHQLETWMVDQGDAGVQTELDAIFRLGKNRNKSRDAVLQAWEQSQKQGRRRRKKRE